jgi:DNA polymerase III delta subunit
LSSYVDLLGWLQAGRKFRLVWLWGDDGYLIEAAVDALKPGESVCVWATGKNDGAVWDELNQFPAKNSKRHVIVRDAHLLKNVTAIVGWWEGMRRVSATFVSDRDFDGPVWYKAKRCPRGHLLEHVQRPAPLRYRNENCVTCRKARLAAFRNNKGRIVMCARPRTKLQRDQAVKVVAARAGCASGMASALLDECGWSLGMALQALKRLSYLGVPTKRPLNELVIKQLAVSSSAGDDYVSALRRGDRAAAATLAVEIDPDDIPAVLVRCERWISQAQRGASAVRAGRTTSDLCNLLSVSWGEAETIKRNAGRWSAAGVSRATEALAEADRAWHRDYGRVGVLERLALSW